MSAETWTCPDCEGEFPTVQARAGEGALRERLANAAPTWHRGMYGCPDDMFSRRDLMAILTDTAEGA